MQTNTTAPQWSCLDKSCTGCGAPTGAPGSATVTTPAGRLAYACPACNIRTQREPRFRRQFEGAAASGLPLPEVSRVYLAMGMHEVPTSAEEFDAALRLPPGTSAAIFGGGRQ